MPLIKAQCTSCNGTLEIDENKEAAICPFCGSAFVVEKAIQQYITNHNTINHIESAVIQSGYTEERYLENGIAQLKLEKYENAKETFEKMSVDYPSSWKSWFGKTLAECGLNHLEKLSIVEDKGFEILPAHIKEQIAGGVVYWEEYSTKKSEIEQKIEKHVKQREENVSMLKKSSQRRIIIGTILLIIAVAIAIPLAIHYISTARVELHPGWVLGYGFGFIIPAATAPGWVIALIVFKWRPLNYLADDSVVSLDKTIAELRAESEKYQNVIDQSKTDTKDTSGNQYRTIDYYIDILR